MKKFVLASLFLLVASTSFAQTTATVQWNQSETPAVAQAFNFTITIDALPATILQPNCVLVNAVTTCSAPLSGYVPGVHHVVLTASNSFGSASSVFTTGAGPNVPGSSKIIVIIIGN